MFTAWKYDPKDEDVLLAAQEIPFDPVTRRTSGIKACSSCRARKLRCNGEKSGCQRCKSQGLECNYTDTVRRKRTGNSSATTASPKSIDRSDTRKSSTSSTTTSSTAASTSPSHSNVELQHPPGPQQEQQKAQCQQQQQQQQQLQQQDHDDLSWLETQTPSIDFFADVDMPEDPILHHDDITFVEDLGARDNPSDMALDLASSTMLLHQTFLPPIRSPSNLAADETGSAVGGFRSHATCQCLYPVLMVMDKLNVQDDSTIEKSVNELLVLHKEALSNGTNMLGCTACIGRVENMLVLAMLIDKLARLCYSIVHAPIKGPTSSLSLGDYMVDSAEEYAVLISSLLGVHLRRLQTMAQRLHQVSSRFQSDTLTHRLTVCSGFVTKSLDTLRNMGR